MVASRIPCTAKLPHRCNERGSELHEQPRRRGHGRRDASSHASEVGGEPANEVRGGYSDQVCSFALGHFGISRAMLGVAGRIAKSSTRQSCSFAPGKGWERWLGARATATSSISLSSSLWKSHDARKEELWDNGHCYDDCEWSNISIAVTKQEHVLQQRLAVRIGVQSYPEYCQSFASAHGKCRSGECN